MSDSTRIIADRPWEEALREGAGALELERAAILCSERRRELGERARRALGSRGADVLGLARRHVPRRAVEAALARLTEIGADGIVALGGGSAIGLGKALRLAPQERALAFIALPTTYAGSEMTEIYGVREGGEKRVGRDARVRPDLVIYDPALTADLPREIAAASLLNALAHAVDSLYASGATAVLAGRAESAIAEIAGALRGGLGTPEARRRAQRGAMQCGVILDSAGMALHHKLAHVLAGTLDLPHAETHAVLLPHVIAFNAPAAPEATRRIAAALGADDPAGALYDLAQKAGAPTRLESFGLAREAALEAAVKIAAAQVDNPRRGSEAEIAALLEAARRGIRPSIDRAR